jgi:SAM-dependent methyltransferase
VSAAPLETRTLERCLVCEGERLRTLPLVYEFRQARFPLVECDTCRMRFLAVQPLGRSLADLYSRDYFEADYRCGRSRASSFDESAFVAENRGLLDAFQALVSPGRLLDVGCASGWLLDHARARGWQAQGVELSEEAVRFARERGLQVHHGDLAGAHLPAASFDLIYMGDVLEHVPDCRATLAEVARVLSPGGVLYLRGPITTHSLARTLALAGFGFLRRSIVLREPPYHLWEFTPRSLSAVLARVGLEVASLRQSKIPPGRSHGSKSQLQRVAIAIIDAINVPITLWGNAMGDRLVLVARRPAGQVGSPPGR